MTKTRIDGRSFDQLRPIKINYDYLDHADSSVLLEFGNTKVLAAVTLQHNLPPFLRGQKVGWLTAEYEMLPCATHKRTTRESTQHHRNSRSIEISRLIGRVLRSVVDLSLLPEKSIIIDCDILQADGGTRVTSITAASMALELAVKRWLNAKIIEKNILKEQIAAISVGIANNNFLLDLSYNEDYNAEADLNFVMTSSNKIIEIQGTAEKRPLCWKDFEQLKDLAQKGITQIFETISKNTPDSKKDFKNLNFSNHQKKSSYNTSKNNNNHLKPAFFSIGKRLEQNT